MENNKDKVTDFSRIRIHREEMFEEFLETQRASINNSSDIIAKSQRESVDYIQKYVSSLSEINKSTYQFIEFFIENRSQLSDDMQAYVSSWIIENRNVFKEAKDRKIAADGAIKSRNDAVNGIRNSFNEVLKQVRHISNSLYDKD